MPGSTLSTQPTPIERLRRSGVRPDRSLGQNFLIDPNIVDVIERTASLGPEDVVLEVGPGLGVLTQRLLERCGLVHSVELDGGLAAMLDGEFGKCANFRLTRGDALRLDLGTLEPSPGKFVSNLPYNVAAPLVMKSLEELPGLDLWCLMLQKEISDRLFAEPGSAAYGAISVMLQLQAERLSARTISGNVFYPRPRVRSSLLAFRRRPGASLAPREFTAMRNLVQACFSHRRKTLVNSLAEADAALLPSCLALTDNRRRKDLVAQALAELELPGDARPQSLSPSDYMELAEQLNAVGSAADA